MMHDKTIAGLKWLGGRLERRAKDARQAETAIRTMDPKGYPHAQRLANVHAKAAEIYEQAVEEVKRELEKR